MKHRLAAVAAALCIAALAVGPASAAAPMGGALAYTDQCSNTPTLSTIFTGAESTTSSSSSSRSGVSATVAIPNGVFVSSGFETCFNGGGYRTGPFVGVGIQPKFEHPSINGAHGMWLGVILCGGGIGFDTYCQAPESHYIVSYGKCTNGNSVIVDLGPTTGEGSTRTLAIYLNTDQYWYFNINGGSYEFRIPNSYNSCWTNTRKAIWGGHRWDFGDSVGDDSSHASYWTDMRFGVYGQGWFDANLSQVNCVHDEADDTCDVIGTDNLKVWSQT